MSSYAHLSDVELREELSKMGASVGPITAGTRSVYEKKLDKLRKDAKKSPAKPMTTLNDTASTITKQSARKTVVRRSTRAKAGASEAEISDSEEPNRPTPPSPTRRSSSTRSTYVAPPSPIVPGRANISVSSISPVEIEPPSPRRRPLPTSTYTSSGVSVPLSSYTGVSAPLSSYTTNGVNVSPSRSMYSRRTVLDREDTPPGRDPYAYSSADDSDHQEESSRYLVNKSVNTSFQPRSQRSYLSSKTSSSVLDRRPPLITPAHRRQPSPFQSMLDGLNKFRLDTLNALRQRLSWGAKRQKSPDFDYGSSPGHYRIRDGGDTMHIDKQPSGDWRFSGSYRAKTHRQLSMRLGDGFPRVLLILLAVFLCVLGCAYIASAHRDQVQTGWRVFKGAAKDTADFFYRYAIVPTIVIGTIALVVVGCYMLGRYRRNRILAEKKRMFDMVDQIIDVLRDTARTASSARDACVAVPHVRDMLIRAADRKAKAEVWESAVAYINENESRVSTETKFVNGQECLVWRWLPNDDKDDPAWQGSAFSDAQANLNAPREPYSECLKLRGMFELSAQRGTDWPDFIQDALLEKLGAGIRVLHVAVDKTSKEGVVFMKLKTKEEAERAYKVLHGSWFDGRIVSVKYLRTERYHERFPDAKAAAYPLQVKKPRHTTRPY